MTIQVDSGPTPVEAPGLGSLIEPARATRLLKAVAAGSAFVLDVAGRVVAASGTWPLDLVASRTLVEQSSPDAVDGRDLATAPIAFRDRRLGAVVVLRDARPGIEACQELASALADTISEQAGTALEMQSLVGELVLRYEELSVVYDSAETIVSVMDLDEVSRRILEKASDMLDVDNASLMLLDADTRTLRIQDAIGLERKVVDSIRLRQGEEISGWVAKEGKPLLVEDIESHPLFKKVNKERYINRSLLSVPLKIKDRVIGVLNVNNKRSGAVFNSGDLKLLSALAGLAAISIENAHTYKNAITDRLTRLYNYGFFREELGRKIQLANQQNTNLSLLMFDIDYFKNFNDKNGHELANVALVRIANICLENSRQKGDRIPDLVARYGGEEFMILLFGVAREFAYKTAERVRVAVQDTQFNGGENQPGGRVTISVGVATYPTDVTDGEQLVNAADKALYRAKKAGRNNVQVAVPSE